MKTKILALFLFAGSCMFARTHFAVGVGVGFGYPGYVYGYHAPAPPAVPYAYSYAPSYVAPGYGYTWVPGYYDYVGARYSWRAGYWARPPYRAPTGMPLDTMSAATIAATGAVAANRRINTPMGLPSLAAPFSFFVY
jgi:hypothetical protein